ncbi:hypothetical protein M3Y97_00056700 [Aphelenchoides bicaudatus]|nr:hypothetical protein M3Y97_00056700 [Aphelenchoides bicaudatus]
MKREDAEQLTNHYYRLYTSIRSVVDTSPPVSLYASPKSTFYLPFAMRKHQRPANPQPISRRKGKEELAHFLALKRTRSQSQIGFNSFAQLKSEPRLNLSELDLPQVRSKLLDSRNYQPPSRLKLHSGESPSSSSSSAMNASINSLPPSKPKKTNERAARRQRFSDVYDQFKDRVLSEILLRNVFTNRIIEDSFRREIARHPELDQRVLAEIMTETSRNSSSVQTSSNQSSVSKQSISNASPQSNQLKAPANKLINNNGPNFRIDASPPRTVSSLSSDIEEIVQRLSNSDSYTADREPSLNGFESNGDSESETSEPSSNFNDVMNRARQKS